MYLPKEDLGLLLGDFTKMPILVRDTILPEVIKQLVKHQDKLTNGYVENIQVVYNMYDNSLDILIIAHPDFPGCNWEGCADQIVKVNPPAEAKMSVINHLWIFISVYANMTSYEENGVIDAIQEDVLRRTHVLATGAKSTLNEHTNELLSKAIEGEGSLANKIPIQRIVMRILDDMVRVTVIFPQDENGHLVKPIDEVKTGVNLYPDFFVESLILGEPEIVTPASRQSLGAVAGKEVVVRSELENRMTIDQLFTYVVQVKDENDVTVALDAVEGSVAWSKSRKVSLAWVPESAGKYEIKTFVWRDFASAQPLAASRSISVTVMNDVMDVEHSYDNFLTTYVGFPENKKRYEYCVPIDSYGGTCDSFIGYKEYLLTLFSEKNRDIKLNVENVPKGMWVKLVPQQLNVGPVGSSVRMIVAGGGPFTSPAPDIQSLIIQAESSGERTTIGDLSVRTDIPTLTILNSPEPIEFPAEIDVSGESSFRIFGAVYDPDEPSRNSLPVNLSVLGLLQEGRIVPLPSWLKVDILDPSFSLNDSQPYYFVIRATRTSAAPLGVHTIVIEEIIDGQRFTQNLQIKVMEPTRLTS